MYFEQNIEQKNPKNSNKTQTNNNKKKPPNQPNKQLTLPLIFHIPWMFNRQQTPIRHW